MSRHDFIQLAAFFIILGITTPFLGGFMTRVFKGEKHLLSSTLGWIPS